MSYLQITENQRYIIAHLRTLGKSVLEIARESGRHRSTIAREINRNRSSDGRYQPYIAQQGAGFRRSKSRRNSRFRASDWNLVLRKLRMEWSPEQISLKLGKQGDLKIHWESIYRYIRADKDNGGLLYHYLRQFPLSNAARGIEAAIAAVFCLENGISTRSPERQRSALNSVILRSTWLMGFEVGAA